MELNLGFISLEGFMKRNDGDRRKLKICFIACGQYGGRQGDELARLEHDVLAINTSESDLSDLKVIQKQIKLDGYNGAIKDIERGQAAIRDNRDKVIGVLQSPEVTNADFVFVIAGMGGGTGNAAAPMLLNNLSRVRNPFNGKPSFGAILSVPGTWEKRGIKKNASWGLANIDELIKNEACGSVTLIDNDKLYQMTDSIFSDTETKLDWTDYGNSKLAALITEISYLTTLPSGKTFDEDELLDVWSTPGYLSYGKTYIYDDESLQTNSMSQIIERSFRESPTANDYDYELDSVNGFVTVVHPKGTKPIISDSDFRLMEERFGKYAANAEKPHSGLIENNQWGSITSKSKLIEDKPKAILYSGLVCQQLPLRITRMLQEIEEEERDLETKRNERINRPTVDLSAFKNVAKKEIAAAKGPIHDNFDLFDEKPAKSPAKRDDFDL